MQGKQANREDGSQYQLNLFDLIYEDDLNGLENKVATYLDRQERLFFWYRKQGAQGLLRPGMEARQDLCRLHLYAAAGRARGRRRHFIRSSSLRPKACISRTHRTPPTKRGVFDICSEHAAKRNWADFVPAMRNKVVNSEVVDEDEWERRLNSMLTG